MLAFIAQVRRTFLGLDPTAAVLISVAILAGVVLVVVAIIMSSRKPDDSDWP